MLVHAQVPHHRDERLRPYSQRIDDGTQEEQLPPDIECAQVICDYTKSGHESSTGDFVRTVSVASKVLQTPHQPLAKRVVTIESATEGNVAITQFPITHPERDDIRIRACVVARFRLLP